MASRSYSSSVGVDGPGVGDGGRHVRRGLGALITGQLGAMNQSRPDWRCGRHPRRSRRRTRPRHVDPRRYGRCQSAAISDFLVRLTATVETMLPVHTAVHCTIPVHWLAVWLSGNALASINVVALRQTRLVPGWVTVCGRVNHLGM